MEGNCNGMPVYFEWEAGKYFILRTGEKRKDLIGVVRQMLFGLVPVLEYEDPQGLYALDLTYALPFKARDLAERSVQEMRRIGGVDADRLTRWGEVMQRAFPEIKAGDRLIGVNLPGRETRFYLNGKLFSTVPDPAFGPAFFGIWLDPRTSEPGFRRELLKRTNS